MHDPRTSRPPAPYDPIGPDDPRLAPVVADVRERLAHVCAHLPADSFDVLVRRIAQTKLRWMREEEAARRRFATQLQPPWER